jgi:hypothetical protein
LVIDIDATLVTAHSDKKSAAATYKRGFGFHPLCTFADHGPAGTGEPLAMLLRPGNAGSNTAARPQRRHGSARTVTVAQSRPEQWLTKQRNTGSRRP